MDLHCQCHLVRLLVSFKFQLHSFRTLFGVKTSNLISLAEKKCCKRKKKEKETHKILVPLGLAIREDFNIMEKGIKMLSLDYQILDMPL